MAQRKETTTVNSSNIGSTRVILNWQKEDGDALCMHDSEHFSHRDLWLVPRPLQVALVVLTT